MANVNDAIKQGVSKGVSNAVTSGITSARNQAGNQMASRQSKRKEEKIQKIKSAYSALPAAQRKRYAQEIQQTLGREAASLSNDYDSMIKSYNSRAGRSGYVNSRDSADFTSTIDRHAYDLRNRLTKYNNLMEIFGDDMDEDFKGQYKQMLGSTALGISEMTRGARDRQNYYSQFKDEADYNSYMIGAPIANDKKIETARLTNAIGNAFLPGGSTTHVSESGREHGGHHMTFDEAAKEYGNNEARNATTYTPVQDIYDKADNRRSSLYSGEYADILNRPDYAEKSKPGESTRGKLFGYDATYDFINGYNREGILAEARSGESPAADPKYAFLTDDEIGVYNYLYSTEGRQSANKFLKSLDAELNAQWQSGSEANIAEKASENTASKIAYSAATVAAQPARALTGLLATGQDAIRAFTDREIDPNSPLRQMSLNTQAIRSGVAESIENNATNEKWGKAGSFLYQTGMSAGDSAVNMLTMSGAGKALGLSGDALLKFMNTVGSAAMSSEVASMSIAESKKKGYSDIGALSLGLVRGGIEYLTERMGGEWVISKIKKNPTSFLNTLVRSMVPEGAEEVMSDIFNEYVNVAIDGRFGTNESYILNAERYFKEQGSENPLLDTLATVLQQELLSFAGGALATFGNAGSMYMANKSSINASAKALNTTPENVVSLMNELGTENPAAIYYLAKMHDVNNVDAFRKKVKEYKTASDAIDTAMTYADNKMRERIFGSETWITKNMQQGKVNQFISRVNDKLDSVGANDNILRRAVTAVALQDKANREKSVVPDEYQPTISQRRMVDENEQAQKWVREIAAEDIERSNTLTVSEEDLKSATYDGANVEVIGVKDEKAQIRTADGETKTVPLSRLNVSEGYEYLLSEAAKRENGNEMLKMYRPGQDVKKYADAWNYAETLIGGDTPLTLEQARQQWGTKFDILTDSQMSRAIELGRQTKAQMLEQAQEKKEKYDALKQEASELERQGVVKRRAGTFRMEGIKEETLNKRQRRVANMVKAVADVLAYDFVLYDGDMRTGGTYMQGGKIHVNINSGKYHGKYLGAFTLAHEVVHALQEYDEAGYLELKNFITNDVLTADELQNLVQMQMDLEPDKTASQALDEAIANGCAKMLLNNEAIQKLAEQNSKLYNWVADKVNEIMDHINKGYKEVDINDKDVELYEAARIFQRNGEEIRERLNKMLITANENKQAEQMIGKTVPVESNKENDTTIGEIDLKDFSKAKGTDGKPLLQVYAFQNDEPRYREMLIKWGGMSNTEINQLFKTVDAAMDIIKKNLEALDYAWEADIDDRAFSPVKPNSDKLYKVSQDFSTLCRKRILQGLVANHLQAALDRSLTREEGIAIRDALIAIQKEGKQIEVACALCYVESARMRSPAQIQRFLDNRERVIRDYFTGKDKAGAKLLADEAERKEREAIYTEEGMVRGKGTDNTMYDVRDAKTASLKKLPGYIATRIRNAKKAARAGYALTAEQQAIVDTAKGMSVTDFTTPEGLENLAKNHREIFDAYTSFIRNATKSKGIENDTWWRAGDSASVSDLLIEQMNAENGLRSQSWSDFQVKHLMDYIAATIEFATRGAKQQAYTKVIDYVDLMGLTNVMINMSLIPTREFNGKLAYDDVEGFVYKKALELRDKYHATAGTICIGIDNQQIIMLLADDKIDYVIPYHRSGMAAHIRAAMHIPQWSEYEAVQNEQQLTGAEARANAEKFGVKLLDTSDPNWHVAPKFSDWFDLKTARQEAEIVGAEGKYGVMTGGYAAMKKAADLYLKLCAERGLAPKFGYGKADFTSEENYWKLLIDRKMVDNVTGEIIEQKAIKPIFDLNTVQRILNDELERYGKVKEDQNEAIRRVTEAFLGGQLKGGMTSEEIERVMQKPVDNISIVNITQNSQEIKTENKPKNQKWSGQTVQEYEAREAVRDVMDHGDAGDDNLVLVGRMPKFIRDLIGLDGDFYVYRNHLYENIVTEKIAKEDGRYKKDGHFHGIGEERAVQAIMALENPALTIKDTRDGSNPEIVMVLPVIGEEGSPLVAAIGFYENQPVNGSFKIKPHITLSIYEKLEGIKNERGETYKDLATFIDDAVNANKVISYDKEMSDSLPVIAKRSRLGNITASSLNDNVAQFRKEVNDFREKNKINYQKWAVEETAEEKKSFKDSILNLQAENRILRARAEYWKAQTRKTKENSVRQQDTDRLARELLKKYESRADRDEVKTAMKALGDWLVQTDELDYDELYARAEAIAEDIISGNYALLDNSQQENLDRLKDYLKNTPVNLSKSDFRDTGDEGFRKKYGRYFTVSERGRTIDSLWGEMAAMFGEGVFPEDVYAPGDMLNMIADYLDMWKPQYGNEFELFHDEAVNAATNEIIDAILSEDVRQTPATYADKAQQKLNSQIAKDRERLGALREAKNARIEELKRQAAEKNRQIRLAEKAAKYEAVSKVKEHYQDMMKRQRNKRSDAAMRNKIRKIINSLNSRLAHPTDKKYVPAELVSQTIDLLNLIDMDTGRGSVNVAEKLAKIRAMYERYKNDEKYSAIYDESVSEALDQLALELDGTKLVDMNSQQLERVLSALKMMDHMIHEAVNVRIGNEEREAFEVAREMMTETRQNVRKPKDGIIHKWFTVAHLRADVMFKRFSGFKAKSTWEKVARMLNDGQLKQTSIKLQLSIPFAGLVNDTKNMLDFQGLNALGKVKEGKLIDIGLKDADGNTIKVTHDIAVGIYMDLLNEDNRRHFIHGGKKIPNLQKFYNGDTSDAFGIGSQMAVGIARQLSDLNHEMAEVKQNGGDTEEIQARIDDILASGESYADEVKASIEKQMTAFDKAWVKAMQQLFDVDSKRFLNETTMEVYGIEKAQVDNYFPITADPHYLTQAFEEVTKDMNLENVGFMKERVKSGKPTYAMGSFSVVNRQIDKVSQYCGLMPAIRNFNKIWNKQAYGYSDSLKQVVTDKFGESGIKWVGELIADLAGGRKTEDTFGVSRVLAWTRSNLAQTSLTLNIRVALSQAASYPTAAAELGAKALTKAFQKGRITEEDRNLIAKWSPLLAYRMQGYSTVELGDIKNSNRLSSRVWKKMRWATGWIQAVDGATVARLWYASEYWVQDNLKLEKGSNAYYEAVAKKFNDVVEKTQPNYTVMQRATILRSPSDLTKALTMFMTQRLQNANILYDSAMSYSKVMSDMQAGRNDISAADVAEAKRNLVRAISSQLAQAVVYTAFRFAASVALRGLKKYRDDDDELTAKSISLGIMDDFCGALAGTVIGGDIMYDLLMAAIGNKKWYGLSVNGVESVSDLMGSLTDLAAVDWTDEGGRAKGKKKIMSAATSLCQFLGIPLSNGIKIGEAMYNWIVDISNGKPFAFEAGVDWLTESRQKAYDESALESLGISEHDLARMIRGAKGDGSLSQEKAGMYLSDKVADGELTAEQASEAFDVMTQGSKTFEAWQDANASYLSMDEDERAEYDDFEERVNVSSKSEVYDVYLEKVEPLGVDIDQYIDILNSADEDGNGSLKQDEIGAYLYESERRGAITHKQAAAIWSTLYRKDGSKTYDKWLEKNS